MFFKFERKANLIKVNDSFVRLKNMTQHELDFEFLYSVKQTEVIKRNAVSVKVTITSRVVNKTPMFDSSHVGTNNTPKIIKNIIENVPKTKSISKQQVEYVVATKYSDILSNINNSLFQRLKSGMSAANIPELKTPKLKLKTVQELKEKNEVQPLFKLVAHKSFSDVSTEMSSSINLDTKLMMKNMIARQKLDPSKIVDMTNRSLSLNNTFGGMVRTIQSDERTFDISTKLLNRHVFSRLSKPSQTTTNSINDSQTKIYVVDTEVRDEVQIPVNISLNEKNLNQVSKNSVQFIVKFELIDNKGIILDVVEKQLDTTKYIHFYQIPKKPPIVSHSINILTSKANLEIKQVDKGAQSVEVWKKIISSVGVIIDDYALIGRFPVTLEQKFLNIEVDALDDAISLYRVIPIGVQNNKGFDYTNVVVSPKRLVQNKAISLNAKSIDIGVEIEARSIPPEARSIVLKYRDMTIFQKEYSVIENIVTFIDNATRTADNFSIVHRNVQADHVYEYIAEILYDDGTSTPSQSVIHEHFIVVENKVDIQVENFKVSSGEFNPNVTFDVKSLVIDSNVSAIKSLLEQQGILEYFNEEILQERDFLNGLIAHSVQRINLTTGVAENFGTILTNHFDDVSLGKTNAVLPLEYGNKYRYEISTLIRSPETLLNTLKKSKIDVSTNKEYQFKPSKFLHPIVLTTGMITSEIGLKIKFSKDSFSHGRVGTVKFLDVSFDRDKATVINLSAIRFDNKTNVISWKVVGNVSQVDHFLISKDEHGVRTLIGKTHSEFQFGNAQFIHELTNDDFGAFSYIVVPIFNDYEIGPETQSNITIVD